MGDVTITPQTVTDAGLTEPTQTSLATGNTYQVPNDGNVLLYFEKTGAGDATITITTPKTVNGLAVSDRTITVSATTGRDAVGPFPPDVYNSTADEVEFTTDEDTDLTVIALRW